MNKLIWEGKVYEIYPTPQSDRWHWDFGPSLNINGKWYTCKEILPQPPEFIIFDVTDGQKETPT